MMLPRRKRARMLLTISTTLAPATDLGFLLHKNPARPQDVELPFGRARIFYPEATDARCTAALMLEVDPVGLVRNRQGPSGDGGTLDQYVNDRPYVASSFMSVAISRAFGSALSGTCVKRPELVGVVHPLVLELAAVPCHGGETLLRALFEPLGYAVAATRHALDDDGTPSRYFTVRLSGQQRLTDALSHLYVLIPVLDDDKHYWVTDDEVEKLLRHGEGWLATHPDRALIARRYLKHQRSLANAALERLEPTPEPEEAQAAVETTIEQPLSLNEQRLEAVRATLTELGAKRVVDLGCGEGKLIKALLGDRGFTELVGLDVSTRALETARDRLKLDRLPELQRKRITLLQGSLVYRDARLRGFDAATCVEVIEHLDAFRLEAFARVLFGDARPTAVVLTTPNAEHNVKFASLPVGAFRHKDHRFEWTRAELRAWADAVAARFGYRVEVRPIGPDDPIVGAPTQMAVFSR